MNNVLKFYEILWKVIKKRDNYGIWIYMFFVVCFIIALILGTGINPILGIMFFIIPFSFGLFGLFTYGLNEVWKIIKETVEKYIKEV